MAALEDALYKPRSQDSSVGIATGYGLDRWGSNPGRGKGSLLYSVQTGSEN
jgi:hypothetical protein